MDSILLIVLLLISLSFSNIYNVGPNQTYPTIFSVVERGSSDYDRKDILVEGHCVDIETVTIFGDVYIVGNSRTEAVLHNMNNNFPSYSINTYVTLSFQTLTFNFSNKISGTQQICDVYVISGVLIAEDVSFTLNLTGPVMTKYFFYFDEYSYQGVFVNCSFVGENGKPSSSYIFYGSEYDSNLISITECLFSGMPTAGGDTSGILHMRTSFGCVHVSSVTFRNITSKPKSGASGEAMGSVLDFRDFLLADIQSCLFERINNEYGWYGVDNYVDGGAIYATGLLTPSHLLNVSHTTFRLCHTGGSEYYFKDGGAICLWSVTFNILSCFFVNCTVSHKGGAVMCYYSNGIINNTYFVDNYAGFTGGAISIYADYADDSQNLIGINASVFIRNRCYGVEYTYQTYGDDIYMYFNGEKRLQVDGSCSTPLEDIRPMYPVVMEISLPTSDPNCDEGQHPYGCQVLYDAPNPFMACTGCITELSCIGDVGGSGTTTQAQYDPSYEESSAYTVRLLWIRLAIGTGLIVALHLLI